MINENNTSYAILGLLTTGCRTGYSIKQMIDNSLNHFWKISYGQIYPTLKLMVEKGYATVQVNSQENKPDQKVYTITEEGEEALRMWLQQPIIDLPIEKNELLLKLFFSRHQSKNVTIEHIDSYEKKQYERYHNYITIKEMIQKNCSTEQVDAPFWIITLDYGIRTTQAVIDWCVETKKILLEQKEI